MAGWSQNTWNTGSWGTGVDNVVIPTGIAAAFGIGSASTDSTVEAGWGRDGWGQRAWGNPSQIVTPVTPEDDMTMSLNSVSITAEINAGWGAKNWGDNAWGIAGNLLATGVSITGATGSPTIQIDHIEAIGNFPLTLSLGNEAIDIVGKVFPTGIAMTSTLGTADAGPDAMATGNQANMALGAIDAFNQTGWGRQGWNVNAWGVEGQFANVDVTGIAMTAGLSSVTMEGESVVTLNTLNVGQLTLGTVDPAPDAGITGNFMLANLGNLGMQGDYTDIPTGIPMTAALNSVSVDLNTPASVTGQSQQVRLSSAFNILIHVDISVTGLGLTMNQGSGNALIWNEVNTGSAPIDPPGWQEVAA